MSAVLWRTIGVLEIAGVAGVLIGMAVPPLGIAAGVGLALLMVGAIATRLRVHDPLLSVAGDVAVLALVAVYIATRIGV